MTFSENYCWFIKRATSTRCPSIGSVRALLGLVYLIRRENVPVRTQYYLVLTGNYPILTKQEAHVGHCRSPEYNERVKNLTSEWNQKQQSFIPHASRSLLCIRFVAVAFWAKKQFFKMGTPLTYLCPALDPPLGRYGRNIFKDAYTGP